MMKRTLLAVAMLVAGATASAAEITLYGRDNFSGRRVQANTTIANLANTGFNDRAQSLRVERGYWIFCSDAGFQGTCRTFGPGSYPELGWGLENRVSSGRRISNDYPYKGPPRWSQR